MIESNIQRTGLHVPGPILRAIDHVRQRYPGVDLVVFNVAGRWQYMGEDFERVVFPAGPGIDLGILEAAQAEAERVGLPCVFQAYTGEVTHE